MNTQSNSNAGGGCPSHDLFNFDEWWKKEGSGMPPAPEEDKEEHTRRVAKSAWERAAEQSEIENAELRQYSAHALGMLNKLEYEREEDGKGELVAILDLDWFFHVKRRLGKILISPPND